MRNLRLAFRMLFRSPFVTVVAVLSLSLGIGANTAVYSMFDQLLRRPLPVPEPARLVNLSAPGLKSGSTSCNIAGDCDQILSYPMYRDLESAGGERVRLAGHRSFQVNVGYGNETLNGEGLMVSGSYFGVLGLRPLRGRLLTPEDDQVPGSHFVAVLGHNYWGTRMGSDPEVVGRSILINGRPFTIVGIAPEGFEGTTTGVRPMVYIPLSMRGVVNTRFTAFENRRNYWIYAFGRLQPGVTLEQAAAALNATYTRLIQEVEAPLQPSGLSDQAREQFRSKQLVLSPGARGQSSVHDEAKIPVFLLFATAAMVLLIACANVANLLLARGASRDMEMAVRLSLGANRRSVVGQLLTEAIVLALMGGIASVVIAKWTLAGVGAILPPEASETMTFALQPRLLGFAALLSLATGLLFGLFPALHSTRPDLVSTIRANAGNLTVSRTAARFRTTLATAQIALSMMLLICAGLFLRSLSNVTREELGLRPDNVVTFQISPERNGYTGERSRVLFDRLEQELAALPGVTSVSSALVPIIAGSTWSNDVSVEGFERTPDTDVNARFNAIGPAYFATLGIPLLAGREFTMADAGQSARVAIVNESFAKKFSLGRDVIGRMMAGGNDELDTQIIGLVKDAKYNEVKDQPGAQYFTPWRQDEQIGTMTFYVHTSGAVAQLLRQIPGLVARLDPNLPVEELKSMPQQVRDNIFMDRMISMLATSFALLATLLAGVGLYGVIAYTVARRTREIGVRMALGATGGEIRNLALRQVLMMLLIGGVIGVLAALQLGKGASSILFGLSASDPIIITLAVATLSVLSLAAGYLPARRAARIDPMKALRQD